MDALYFQIFAAGQKRRYLRDTTLANDNELIKLHAARLKDDHYLDAELHILTRDLMWAAEKYIDIEGASSGGFVKVEETFLSVEPTHKQILLRPSFCDHVKRQRSQSRLGALGELFVLQLERDRLPLKFSTKLEHVSKTRGDGLGYDILSVNEAGQEKYIEVKTTTGGPTSPFFVTAAELQRSQESPEQFELHGCLNSMRRAGMESISSFVGI